VTAVAAATLPAKRTGPANWLHSYAAMLRWEIVGARLFLPLLVIMQIVIGAGFVVGFGLLIPNVTTGAALYLTTGAVVMSLITIGLLVTPQLIAQQKMQGSYEYIWSLPVPRSAAVAASTSLAGLIAVCGIVAALLVGAWRYDISFAVHPSVIPAMLLTVVAASLLGAAVAHGVGNPQATMLYSQVAIFFTIGFSPINFPIDRLPGWLAAVHHVLPFHHMALIVRASLTNGMVTATVRDWLNVLAWTLLAGLISGLILVRRR
jgi:ABC-2 type transport system permease protein